MHNIYRIYFYNYFLQLSHLACSGFNAHFDRNQMGILKGLPSLQSKTSKQPLTPFLPLQPTITPL